MKGVNMLKLPWQKSKTNEELLSEEVGRQLQIMRSADVDSEEYNSALEKFKSLNAHALNEEKLKEIKHKKWFDGAITVLLAIGTITTEQWTPITTKWFSTVARRFESRKGGERLLGDNKDNIL